MAVTAEEVANAVLAAVGCDAGPQLCTSWLSERYRELTNRARFRHLLNYGELVLPAMIDDGTVTVTAESDIVVGNATARAAWGADPEAVVGRFIRIDGQRQWFQVSGLNGSNDLVLTTPWVLPFDGGTSPLSGAAYKLVERFHRLAPDLRHIGIFTHPRLLEPLEELDHQEMDQAMTGRVLVADLPRFWSERGSDADGRKLVEIYPFARSRQLVTYSYFTFSPPLTIDSSIPPEIDLHVLKAGALVDVYRWEMAKALRANQVEAGATWRNEMRAQMTTWDDKIREAVKADRGGRSLAFQMHTEGFPAGGDRYIRNARDYVWARGNRP